jgi:hypothetical protein
MDISNFLPKQPEQNPVIQKDIDADKYNAVAAKLCEKRKTLEDSLKGTEITPEVREENAIDLMRLKESMKVFGITEIDYQAYLAYKEKEVETSVQLELF